MRRKFVLIYGIAASVLGLAGLLSVNIGSVSAANSQDSNGVGGTSPWPSALLSVLILLPCFAALVHVWPGEQPPSRADALSLILIVVISCLCLLASLWAAFSGADLGATLI
jgi:hypothetical protein